MSTVSEAVAEVSEAGRCVEYPKVMGGKALPKSWGYLLRLRLTCTSVTPAASQGSVVTESVLQYRVSNASISTTDIEQQLTQRLNSQNSFGGLQLDNIRANSGSSPPATTAPAPLVPGWGIALLVLVCILLVLSILLFILLFLG
ncbi:mucin-1-like [Mauremys reevesii]|uniref:mucin-1-like n=1 Tax=Mauremys reevesii TaxID=260615 RepID=UPI0019400E56|nr:mucin-1-like [Mauremys reevesii]